MGFLRFLVDFEHWSDPRTYFRQPDSRCTQLVIPPPQRARKLRLDSTNIAVYSGAGPSTSQP